MKDVTLLLTICAAMTALVTEALKKMLGNRKYSVNILAAAVSIAVAGLICAAYIILTETVLTAKVWVYVTALIILSWLCAMVGYDKVKQTLLQFTKTE
ncbi:MAG: aminopeptidase [Lachnospiraceae bacterium]|nr:aminopeptidase [Lachnospiraceae bacterium]